MISRESNVSESFIPFWAPWYKVISPLSAGIQSRHDVITARYAAFSLDSFSFLRRTYTEPRLRKLYRVRQRPLLMSFSLSGCSCRSIRHEHRGLKNRRRNTNLPRRCRRSFLFFYRVSRSRSSSLWGISVDQLSERGCRKINSRAKYCLEGLYRLCIYTWKKGEGFSVDVFATFYSWCARVSYIG